MMWSYCISKGTADLDIDIQGHPERMSKVKTLWKSQFSPKLSFLSCFRCRISDKFVPYSIQVYHNHPKASKEDCSSNVLSGSVGCRSPTNERSPLRKDPNCVFQLVRSRISSMNEFIFFYTANFAPYKPKHKFWVFAQSLRVRSRPQSLPKPESTLEAQSSLDALGWWW